MFTHTGVVANYLTSPRALKVVEDVIAHAETLREKDARFNTLGIGLAEGELWAEFGLFGKLKPSRDRPLGKPLSDAIQVEREPGKYQEILRSLRNSIRGGAAA